MVGRGVDGDHVVHVVRAQSVDDHVHHFAVHREALEKFLRVFIRPADIWALGMCARVVVWLCVRACACALACLDQSIDSTRTAIGRVCIRCAGLTS